VINANFTNDENDQNKTQRLQEQAHRESVRKPFQTAHNAIKRGIETAGKE